MIDMTAIGCSPLFHGVKVRYKTDSGEMDCKLQIANWSLPITSTTRQLVANRCTNSLTCEDSLACASCWSHLTYKENVMTYKMASKLFVGVLLFLTWCLAWPQTTTHGEPPSSLRSESGINVPFQPGPMVPAGPSLAAAGDTIGFSREIAGGSQAITLINTTRRWMAVYHVDQAGQIRLVSSRPLDADFSFQFNATAPLPEEIRRLQGG